MKVRICPQCGKHNSENSFSCEDCGQTLSLKTLIEIGADGKPSGKLMLTNISSYFKQELEEILKTTINEGFEDIVWGNNFSEISETAPYRFGFFVITSLHVICVYYNSDMTKGKPVRSYLDLDKEARSRSIGGNLDWLFLGILQAIALRKILKQKLIVNSPTAALTSTEKASRVVKTYDVKKLLSKDLIGEWYGEILLKSVIARFQHENKVTLTFIDSDAAPKAYESLKSN